MVVRGTRGIFPGFIGGFADPELSAAIKLDHTALHGREMRVLIPRKKGNQAKVERYDDGRSCIAT